MKYRIKFTMWDGVVEEVNVDNAKSRNEYIATIMRHKHDVALCSYVPIYKNESYGNDKIVF